MTTKQWEFEPNQLIVEQGQIVTIRLVSTDVPHGFAITEYNIQISIEPEDPEGYYGIANVFLSTETLPTKSLL